MKVKRPVVFACYRKTHDCLGGSYYARVTEINTIRIPTTVEVMCSYAYQDHVGFRKRDMVTTMSFEKFMELYKY